MNLLIFQRVLADPIPSFFRVQLGQWFAQGDTGSIEKALGEEIERSPSETELWLEMADLKKSQGDYDGAVAAYQRYLSLQDDWQVRVVQAVCLEEAGRFANAEGELEALDGQHPDDPELVWGLARLRLDQARWPSVRGTEDRPTALREAQKLLAHLVDLQPYFVLAKWQLAETDQALGDRDEALKYYEETLGQDASYKLAHRRMARLLAEEGKYAQALVKYQKAMAIEPDDLQLKQEARRVARLAPAVAQAQKQQRLEQWKDWVPPTETPIATSPTTIRVGLMTGMARVLLRGRSMMLVMTPAQHPLTLLAAGQDYQVVAVPPERSHTHQEEWLIETANGKKVLSFSQRLWLEPKDPAQPICLHAVPSNKGYFFAKEEDRAYRGLLEISPHPSEGFTVINRVSLEDYTAGVLPSEMMSNWPLQALEAQAVLARTYVLSKMGHYNSLGFDVSDGVDCQVYRGLRAETGRTDQAVRDTAGMVLTHGGEVMTVAFSAECGGHTQDYEEAWGHDEPVVGVPDYDERYNQDLEFPLSPYHLEEWVKQDRPAYCRVFGLRGYNNFRWVTLLPVEDVEKEAPELGRIRRLVVTRRSSAGWANLLLVEGEKGSKTLKGDLIRSFLGGIRSNLIWIEPQFGPKGWPVEFLIYGGGWGHGVGMCQVGAYGLAEAGKSWQEIVEHYFPEASLTLWKP